MAKFCMFMDLALEIENFLNWDTCDLDAERDEKDRLKLVFEAGQSEEPFASELFILLEGNYFLDIVKQATNIEKLCTITNTEFGLPNQSVVFKSENVLIAAIDTDHRQSAEVVDLLQPYTELAKNVVTLSTKSMIDLREGSGDGQHDVTFIRGINSKFNHIKELQAPNMISGVAAGVASWRTFKAQPVECYVFFIRQIRLDEDSAKKVLKLLQNLGIKDTFDYDFKRRQPSSLFL